MSRINILKTSVSIFIFITFFNFSFSQNSFGSNVSLNIEWQAIDSYTPTFYKGRALPGEEAYIKALAIVDANSSAGQINPDSLYYAWTYNGYYIYNSSGTGMNTVYFTLDKLEPVNSLELDVYSDSSQTTLLGKKIIQIQPTPGLPLLYKKSDNSILTYANAINKKYQDLSVNPGDSFNIIAEPYFFSAKNTIDQVLDYSWTTDGVFNGNLSSNTYNYFAGSVKSIDLKISNNQKILQTGEALINFSLTQ